MLYLFKINKDNRFIWLGAILFLALLFTGYSDPFAIVITYFFESILIGLLFIIKLSSAALKLKSNEQKKTNSFSKIFFFLLLFLLFFFVQSVIIFALFSIADNNITAPYNIIKNYQYALSLHGFDISMLLMILLLIFSNMYSNTSAKNYKDIKSNTTVFKPFLRVFIQQFTIIFSLFFTFIFSIELTIAAILICLRLFVDLFGTHLSSDN